MLIKNVFYRRFLTLTAIIVFLWLLYLLKPVIIPFATAFVLAYLFNPLVKKLEAIRLPRWLAILVVYVSMGVVFLIALSFLVPLIWEQLQIAWQNVPAMVDWYSNTLTTWLSTRFNIHLPTLDKTSVSKEFLAFLQNHYDVGQARTAIMQLLLSSLSVINIISLAVLVPILTFYFLLGWHERLHAFADMLPLPYKPKVIAIARDCDKALQAFVKGQLLVMLLLGTVYAVQLQLIGLEVGIIIGLLAGLASFVPYLGFGLGFIAAIVAGWFQFGADWLHLGLIAAAFMVGQAIEGYILQPLLLGDKIGLSPLWVMFAVLAGASLLGFVGMLLALPVSALILVLVKHGIKAYTQSSFYLGSRQYVLFDDEK